MPDGQVEIVDHRLKIMMKELGDAINESLSDSDQIAEVIARIKDGGYDVFLVLEATIGFNQRDDRPEELRRHQDRTSAGRVGDDFAGPKFLRSLRISVDDER